MKLAVLPALAALVLFSLLPGARADVIPGYPFPPQAPGTVVGSATALGGGLYRYDYTITNLDRAPESALADFKLVLPHLYDHYVYGNGQSPHLDFSVSDIKTSPTLPYGGFFPSPFLGYLVFGVSPNGSGLTLGQSGHVSFVVPFPPGQAYSTVVVDEPDPEEGDGRVGEFAGTVVGPDLSAGIAPATAPEPSSALLLALGGLAWAAARRSRFLASAARSALT